LLGYSFTPSTGRVWTGTISVAQKIIGYPAGTLPAALPQYSQVQYGTGNLGIVKGKVAEQSGTGIPQAALIADGLPTSVLTDGQGYYELALSPGMHRVEAEKFGFGIQPRAVSVASGQVITLDLIGKKMAVLGKGR
jgi:hypothetical protein